MRWDTSPFWKVTAMKKKVLSVLLIAALLLGAVLQIGAADIPLEEELLGGSGEDTSLTTTLPDDVLPPIPPVEPDDTAEANDAEAPEPTDTTQRPKGGPLRAPAEADTWSVNVTISGSGKVEWVGQSNGVFASGSETIYGNSGEQITLFAIPADGYIFKGWENAGSQFMSDNPLDLNSNDYILAPYGPNLTAVFEPENPKIENVAVNVTPPTAGTSANDAKDSFLSVPSDAHYAAVVASFHETQPTIDGLSGPDTAEFTGTFEEGKTYYAYLYVTPESGYELVQGGGGYTNTTFTANGATSVSGDNLYITNVMYEGAFMQWGNAVVSFMPAAKNPTLTLHFCSIDNDDLAEPIVIENVTPGTRVDDAIEDAFGEARPLMQKIDGYMESKYFMPEPMRSYSSMDDLFGRSATSKKITEDMDVYFFVYKVIDEVDIAIEAPIVGTETTTPGTEYAAFTSWDWDEQTNRPHFSVPYDKPYAVDVYDDVYDTPKCYWLANADLVNLKPYVGTFAADTTYFARVWLLADYGYAFDSDDPYAVGGLDYSGTVNVEGGAYAATEMSAEPIFLEVAVSVAAVLEEPHTHTLAKTDKVEPTCTESGTEEYWTCAECGKLFSDAEGKTEITEPKQIAAYGHDYILTQTKAPTCTDPGVETGICSHDASHTLTREIAATGHDWGDWEVTKEPSETEDGEETRVCKNDSSHIETRSIPVLTIEYRDVDGTGSSWTKGSSDSLTFTFKRSRNDETTYSHFTGIQVDGKTVDASNYTAVSGSVIVTLKPDYLDTLSAGDHSLTSLFEDGNNVTVSFTVRATAVTAGTPSSDDTSKAEPSTTVPTSPNTGDDSNLLFWFTILCADILVLSGILTFRRRYAK